MPERAFKASDIYEILKYHEYLSFSSEWENRAIFCLYYTPKKFIYRKSRKQSLLLLWNIFVQVWVVLFYILTFCFLLHVVFLQWKKSKSTVKLFLYFEALSRTRAFATRTRRRKKHRDYWKITRALPRKCALQFSTLLGHPLWSDDVKCPNLTFSGGHD